MAEAENLMILVSTLGILPGFPMLPYTPIPAAKQEVLSHQNLCPCPIMEGCQAEACIGTADITPEMFGWRDC